MSEWLTSGHLVDAVLLLTVLEMLVLALYRRRTGKGVPFSTIGANLLAGLFLMLAVRAAVQAAPLGWIAAALFGAGIAHAVDLRARWRGSASGR